MPRTLFYVVLMLVSIAAAGIVIRMHSADRPRIDRAKLKQVKAGMTRTEIEALLGVPAGDYTTGPFVAAHRRSDIWYLDYEYWCFDEGGVSVRFYSDGETACDVETFSVFRIPEPSLLNRLRAWLSI